MNCEQQEIQGLMERLMDRPSTEAFVERQAISYISLPSSLLDTWVYLGCLR